MITFFTAPRPFVGEFDTLQRRAIGSWRVAVPESQIILFGDEATLRRPALEMDVTFCQELDADRHGPRVARMFGAAERYAAHEWLCYCSADIVLEFDAQALAAVLRHIECPFVIGRRWDVDPGASRERATLHAACGVDYFLYRRGQIGNALDFYVRGGQGDNWFVWKALQSSANGWGMTVIDATEAITAIHVNHGHPEWATGKAGREGSFEQRHNMALCRADGMATTPGVDDAPYVLKRDRLLPRGETRRAAEAVR